MSHGISGLAKLRKSTFNVIPSHLQYDAHELIISFQLKMLTHFKMRTLDGRQSSFYVLQRKSA